MEQMDLLKMTPDTKGKRPMASLPEENRQPTPAHEASVSTPQAAQPVLPSKPPPRREEEEDFFDMISRCQSQRLDDQRCSFVANKENHHQPVVNHHQNHHHYGNGSAKNGTAHSNVKTFEDLMDMIAGVQSKRLDEQRADLPSPSIRSGSATKRKVDTGGIFSCRNLLSKI